MNITLKNLHEATEYDVIKQVGTHLLRQNARSDDGHMNCMYRGQGGLMCAAGCLIAEDEYEASFEGNLWRSLVENEQVPDAHRFLITRLQRIHDDYPPEDWDFRLKKLCDQYAVDSSWIDEVLNERD